MPPPRALESITPGFVSSPGSPGCTSASRPLFLTIRFLTCHFAWYFLSSPSPSRPRRNAARPTASANSAPCCPPPTSTAPPLAPPATATGSKKSITPSRWSSTTKSSVSSARKKSPTRTTRPTPSPISGSNWTRISGPPTPSPPPPKPPLTSTTFPSPRWNGSNSCPPLPAASRSRRSRTPAGIRCATPFRTP